MCGFEMVPTHKSGELSGTALDKYLGDMLGILLDRQLGKLSRVTDKQLGEMLGTMLDKKKRHQGLCWTDN